MYKRAQNRDRCLEVSYGVRFEPRVSIGTFVLGIDFSGAERKSRLVASVTQAAGANVGNTNVRFRKEQASFYLYDHLGNTRVTYTPTDFITHPESPIVCVNEVNSVVDYFPYGKVLRHYNVTDERYLTTQHERDQETDLDYRGARYYDGDIGRFLSLDPHARDYSAWSAYNYVMGNPLAFTDPDGRDVEPSESFQTTGFYSVFLDLFNHNVTFKTEILREYATNPNYHYVLDDNNSLENQGKVSPGTDAITFTESKGYMNGDTPVLTEMFSNQIYTVESDIYRTEIGKAHLLIHEGIHSLAGLLLDRSPTGSDSDHKVWGKYYDYLERSLTEYVNHIGGNYSSTQIKEMALWGIEGSGLIENYINKLVEKNGTDYDTEYEGYKSRVTELMWDYEEE